MKPWITGILLLMVTIGNAAGDQNTADPLAFLPPDVRETENAEWIDRYANELMTLLRDATVSARALTSGALFCRNAAFSDNPQLAARMVYELLTETDFLLRIGRPAGEIKVKTNAAWRQRLSHQTKKMDLKKEHSTVEKIEVDMTILTDKDKTLPESEDTVKDKIDDKIKDKKEKIK